MKENSKKIPKKLKNTVINSFQAKIGWKQMRKREIKIIVPFRSVPTRYVIENSKQIAKKFKKLKKIPLWLHFKRKQAGKGCKREKTKIILPFHSYSSRERKFQKNVKKIQKIKKYQCGIIISQNRFEKAGKQRK